MLILGMYSMCMYIITQILTLKRERSCFDSPSVYYLINLKNHNNLTGDSPKEVCNLQLKELTTDNFLNLCSVMNQQSLSV